MANYITIDGGTTNTRLYLLKSGEIIDCVKLSVGIKDNISGSSGYKEQIKDAINDIILKNGMSEKEISHIICSGMITSEMGLCPLEHLPLPCSMVQMAKAVKTVHLNDISPIPFAFIRGLKTNTSNFENADMMRGEETELMGLCEKLEKDCIYILPGSHSKHIESDNAGRIINFSTFLTGEMVAAISEGTILGGCIDLNTVSCNYEFLKQGYIYTQNHGINAALFKVRTLSVLFNKTKDELYSFFMGAVLHGEIKSISDSSVKKVIIGGKVSLKEPMYILLKEFSDKITETLPDERTETAVPYGAVKIFEEANKVE